MLADLYTLQWYGPNALAVEVDGGDTQAVDLRGLVRLGLNVEGGAQEPDLHATLLVGWGVEVEGIGEVDSFGLKGDIRLGIEVDVAAQPTVFDIVQGVLNAQAAQYNLTGTVGAKINASAAGGDPWQQVIESGYTAAEILRLLAAVSLGNASGLNSGAPSFRDLADSKNRVVATIAGGQRAVTGLDAS